MTDLCISGSDCSIDCYNTRWTSDDYLITIETFITKSDLQSLEDSVVPGAVDVMYNLMGRDMYHDSTFQGNNTIVLTPQSNVGKLSNMRSEKVIFIKHLISEPITGPSGYLSIRLEGYLSGSQVI